MEEEESEKLRAELRAVEEVEPQGAVVVHSVLEALKSCQNRLPLMSDRLLEKALVSIHFKGGRGGKADFFG